MDQIESAYEWNAQRLTDMVMNECQLMERLHSINHYFFFDRGDFFSHFIDGCEELLEKFTSEVNIQKLESLLDMAIRTSSANSDPFKDDVSCELNRYGVQEQLTVTCLTKGALGPDAFTGGAQNSSTIASGINPMTNLGQAARNMKVHEAFTLDYKVRWPLTLILSKRAINKYQLIFRHLLQCKYVIKYLENVWLQHQQTKECGV